MNLNNRFNTKSENANQQISGMLFAFKSIMKPTIGTVSWNANSCLLVFSFHLTHVKSNETANNKNKLNNVNILHTVVVLTEMYF